MNLIVRVGVNGGFLQEHSNCSFNYILVSWEEGNYRSELWPAFPFVSPLGYKTGKELDVR